MIERIRKLGSKDDGQWAVIAVRRVGMPQFIHSLDDWFDSMELAADFEQVKGFSELYVETRVERNINAKVRKGIGGKKERRKTPGDESRGSGECGSEMRSGQVSSIVPDSAIGRARCGSRKRRWVSG